jgi:hypothetical protein
MGSNDFGARVARAMVFRFENSRRLPSMNQNFRLVPNGWQQLKLAAVKSAFRHKVNGTGVIDERLSC